MMRDIWLDALIQSGKTVTIFDLGTLSIEVQEMRSGGAVCQTMQTKRGSSYPLTIRRVYGRFRPSPYLRRALEKEGSL